MVVRRIRPKAGMVKAKTIEVERHPIEPDPFEIAQWYWVTEKKKPWLGCVTRVGSNYVKLTSVGGASTRIHFSKRACLEREHDPGSVIDGKVAFLKKEVGRLMGEVREITARLGVAPQLQIEHRPESETMALVRVTGEADTDSYKNALIRAKEKELPELFGQIKKTNENLAIWMKAEMIPLVAQSESMNGVVERIEGRIFNVSLYAGLTESVIQIREGEPAPYEERLRLMQRRAYMDEECLLDYRHGGMEFKSLAKFDRWIAKKKNMDRILPFPRCLVAMRVRRTKKNRYAETLFEQFVNFNLEEEDKFTYLYLRNGEQLYRMCCDLEFDELIFPNRGEFDMTQQMMFKLDFSRVELITVADYEERVRAYKKHLSGHNLWKKRNPLEKWTKKWKNAMKAEGKRTENLDAKYFYEQANPYRTGWIESKTGAGWDRFEDPRSQGWEPFDQNSVRYDEVMADLKKRIEYYNRLALIVQGLMDRSTVFHPHGPVKTWTPEGFDEAVELVYDHDRALHAGPAPSFEEYSTELRGSIKPGSIVIGQERVWLKKVQAEEKERLGNSYRTRGDKVSSTWKPTGDPGPGFMSEIVKVRAGKAKFVWLRSPRVRGYFNKPLTDPLDMLKTEFSVEVDKLFNVSAYEPGDYLRFFEDPRTRAQYMKWAPCLLSAEDYHAKKRKPQRAPRKDSSLSTKEIAKRITVHLKRMEEDKKGFNKPDPKYGTGSFYHAWASESGPRNCTVRYVAYHGSTTLTKSRALRYLEWLDAGNEGSHHIQDYEEQTRKKT